MKRKLNYISIAVVLFVIAGCSNIKECPSGLNISEPVLLRVTKGSDGVPKVTPEEFYALPGQEVIFIGKEEFSVLFIGISPTDPKSGKGERLFKSKDRDVELKISKEFEHFKESDLPDQREYLESYRTDKSMKSIAPDLEELRKKLPKVTKKYVTVNYAVEIDGIILDPKGKIKIN